MKLILGKYEFTFKPNITYKVYESEWLDSITFFIKTERYEVINNFSMGYRLLINNRGGDKDIPFHSGTFDFLPKDIEVNEL